ncbi:uncharacterized protein LOC132728742 [Ruditapes philippinarum]|uniref:uncharacterized protein LOC132728742 n=1 Tax=Ruditapes philippinarum TaxID=129788 RepID=UPI00295B0460|nr:uncharacterized protein LOC132728742 [Ruditapes philippinarum]
MVHEQNRKIGSKDVEHLKDQIDEIKQDTGQTMKTLKRKPLSSEHEPESTDWRHIGKEDAKLVVFLHPFGKSTFDLQKAKDFHSIVDSIVETTSFSDNDDVLDVVIIMDKSILEEWKSYFNHDMMDQPIVVYKPTTEDSPVDLIEGESNMSKVEADPHYKNLLVQSIAYNKHHRARMADDSIRENALEEFRSKKVIVISGPRCSGKTTLALSLLSSYQDGHYLILTEPDDLSCVRFGVTCVVIIEDLGGKYMFEMSIIQKWLRKLDMLYSAVKDGKLNVIITCLTRPVEFMRSRFEASNAGNCH